MAWGKTQLAPQTLSARKPSEEHYLTVFNIHRLVTESIRFIQ